MWDYILMIIEHTVSKNLLRGVPRGIVLIVLGVVFVNYLGRINS